MSPRTLDFLPDAERKIYHHCQECDLRFLNPQFYLTREEEKKRYELHNNDVLDLGYQKFVEPLFKEITLRTTSASKALDFGCGRGPVLSSLLQKAGYSVSHYDPLFHVDPPALANTYHFVFAVEVVEHFFNPQEEFQRLRKLLKEEGFIGIMTDLYHEKLDFFKWYYRNDPTHVSFYSARTMEWLRENFNFSKLEVFGNRVCLLST